MTRKYGVPDRENPEWTADDIRSARPGSDVLPAAFIASVRRHRGKQKAPTKRMVSLRVAPEVLEAYRATGRGWQVLMHATLAAHAPHRPQLRVRRRVNTVATSTKKSAAGRTPSARTRRTL